jgi:hypothetical protein
MDTTHWWVLGTNIVLCPSLIALGFQSMSTNSRWVVPHWLPKIFFALAIGDIVSVSFYFWGMNISAKIIATVSSIGLLIYLFYPLFKRKGVGEVKLITQEIVKSANLSDTLTLMHRRLIDIQKEKASKTKISSWEFERSMPTLADKMGTVPLQDWPKFSRDIKRRLQNIKPAPIYLKRFQRRKWLEAKEKARQEAQYRYLAEVSKIREEVFRSKKWTFEDGIKASEWLDDHKWGVKELRDNDPQWNYLYKSISHYYEDDKLRELIKKHVDFSYFYANYLLINYYSENYSKSFKSSFSNMLHETLVGSPISPVDVEIAFGELLQEIKKRLVEIGDYTRLGIQIIESDVISEPAYYDTELGRVELIAITVRITLTPPHRMQWAKVYLDCEEGNLEGKVKNVQMPHYLESAETHEIVFDIPDRDGQGSTFAAFWYIREQDRMAHNKSARSRGVITIVADGKDWNSLPFPIPTKVDAPIPKQPSSD